MMTWEELKPLAVKRENRDLCKRKYKCADKRAYNSSKEANRASTGYKKHTKGWIPQVPYKCEICGKWHLTKKRR